MSVLAGGGKYFTVMGVFTPACRVIQRFGENHSTGLISEGTNMTWNSLKRLSICAALLTILASSARAATDTVSFRYGGLVVRHGQVLATKPDGLMTRAEFAAEITVLSDGRLVGGFGLWELGTPDILS